DDEQDDPEGDPEQHHPNGVQEPLARAHRDVSPTRSTNSSSDRTRRPSFLAFSSFVPAFAPATTSVTRSVTEADVRAPSRSTSARASSRDIALRPPVKQNTRPASGPPSRAGAARTRNPGRRASARNRRFPSRSKNARIERATSGPTPSISHSRSSPA